MFMGPGRSLSLTQKQRFLSLYPRTNKESASPRHKFASKSDVVDPHKITSIVHHRLSPPCSIEQTAVNRKTGKLPRPMESTMKEENESRAYLSFSDIVEAPHPLELIDTASTTQRLGGLGIPPPPDTAAMKQSRKESTLAIGIATGITGFFLGGPIVGAVAGFTTAAVIKRSMKKREKNALNKYQKELAEMLSPTCY